jgi:hypothetical protein
MAPQTAAPDNTATPAPNPNFAPPAGLDALTQPGSAGPAEGSMAAVNQEAAAGQQEMNAASDLSTQPLKVAPIPGVATGPHARLLNMIQGLALGADAFGKAIATHGREGGISEVQDYQAKQNAMRIQNQQAAEEQRNQEINQRVNMAHAHMAQMGYQIGLMKLPTELKTDALDLSNKTVDSFTKMYDTGQSMGYDMNDPAQAEEARQRIGVDPQKSEGAITVPFAAGQTTEQTSQAVQQALPPGKSLTDYSVFVSQNGTEHGKGGTVTLLPTQGTLMQMPATPRQIAATQAESESMIAQGRAAGLSEDPNSPNYNPQFAQVLGSYNNLKNVIDQGGKPTTLQLHNLHVAIAGPLTTLVAGTTSAAKIATEQANLAKTQQELGAGARPKNLEDATSMFVQASQAYKANPSDENKQKMANAKEQRDAAYADKLAEVREQAKIHAGASGKGVEGMINTGVNPIDGTKLDVTNAPDELLVDARTGKPIPIKMVSTLKPTMQESNRADFAASTLHSLDLIDKLKAQGKLPNGPITGLTAKKLAALGLGSDSQEAIDLLGFAGSAATGAHVGGRFNVPIMEKMDKMLNLNMNDTQFAAAEQGIRDVMGQYVSQGGRLTVAQWNQMTPEDRKAAMATASSTGPTAGLTSGGTAGNDPFAQFGGRAR